jgi:alkylation response protein AidB-like acyl-CoA dehydrogenase
MPPPDSSAVTELRAYLATVVDKVRADTAGGSAFDVRRAWQRALADGGWAALAWPVEAGGRGLDVRDQVACGLELAVAGVPVLAGVLGINNVGPALMAFGTPEQQASLPKILTTEEIWCQGFSEPEAGSDLASLRTRAVRDGDEFVIDGQKIWTSEGMQGTNMLLLARTDPDAAKHHGISAFTLSLDTPGIERRPIRQISGESDFAEVFFDDVRIPASALLGPVNGGWGVTTTTLGHERAGVIGLAAQLEYDVTRRVSAALAGERGGANAGSALLRQQIARTYAEARIAGQLGMRALADAERGAAPGAEQTLIKLSWSSATQRLAKTLLEVDPNAALEVNETSTQYLRSFATSIAGGTTEVLKNLVGERVLGLPREPRPEVQEAHRGK